MKAWQQYSHILIVGLGQTGLSVARYLQAEGVAFSVVDSRPNPPGESDLAQLAPNAPVQFGAFQADDFAQADCLIVNPGISVKEPLIQAAARRGASIVGDIELFAHAVTAPVIAITGSNGKSSVTTLLAMMAEEAGLIAYAGGNLGQAALDLLTLPVPDVYVMELSSFQLETTYSLRTKAATVLNVTEDHMDRYDNLAQYAAAKQRIYQHCQQAVINREDALVTAMIADKTHARSFGLSSPNTETEYGLRSVNGAWYLAQGSNNLLPISELKTPGLHNAMNALAALALGQALGLENAPMLRTLTKFTGLVHRTQWLRERRGVHWYNDSKGTNVGATLAALSGMPNKTVLIAGGQGKGADFSPLRVVFSEKARVVILIGEDAKKIAQVAEGIVPYTFAATMQEAVQRAAEYAQTGDNVLLSPACASFDMFNNYGHRGEVFSALVRELAP